SSALGICCSITCPNYLIRNRECAGAYSTTSRRRGFQNSRLHGFSERFEVFDRVEVDAPFGNGNSATRSRLEKMIVFAPESPVSCNSSGNTDRANRAGTPRVVSSAMETSFQRQTAPELRMTVAPQ